MPYTEKQRKFFNAAAHDPAIAREHGMPTQEAGRLASEANTLKGEGRERRPVKANSFIDLSAAFGPPRTP